MHQMTPTRPHAQGDHVFKVQLSAFVHMVGHDMMHL